MLTVILIAAVSAALISGAVAIVAMAFPEKAGKLSGSAGLFFLSTCLIGLLLAGPVAVFSPVVGGYFLAMAGVDAGWSVFHYISAWMVMRKAEGWKELPLQQKLLQLFDCPQAKLVGIA